MAKIITIDALSKFFESLKTYFVTRAEYEIDINVPSTDVTNTKWIEIVYPVGSIYMSVSDIDPICYLVLESGRQLKIDFF